MRKQCGVLPASFSVWGYDERHQRGSEIRFWLQPTRWDDNNIFISVSPHTHTHIHRSIANKLNYNPWCCPSRCFPGVAQCPKNRTVYNVRTMFHISMNCCLVSALLFYSSKCCLLIQPQPLCVCAPTRVSLQMHDEPPCTCVNSMVYCDGHLSVYFIISRHIYRQSYRHTHSIVTRIQTHTHTCAPPAYYRQELWKETLLHLQWAAFQVIFCVVVWYFCVCVSVSPPSFFLFLFPIRALPGLALQCVPLWSYSLWWKKYLSAWSFVRNWVTTMW